VSDPIILRFVADKSLTSKLIVYFGGALGFSHVGAITFDGYELGARDDVEQSVTGEPGVQRRPEAYARFTNIAELIIPSTAEERTIFWRSLDKEVGKPYSKNTILGFVLGRNIKDEHPAWDCSTLQAWALLRAGILPRELDDHLRQITPDTLYAMAFSVKHAREQAMSGAWRPEQPGDRIFGH